MYLEAMIFMWFACGHWSSIYRSGDVNQTYWDPVNLSPHTARIFLQSDCSIVWHVSLQMTVIHKQTQQFFLINTAEHAFTTYAKQMDP